MTTGVVPPRTHPPLSDPKRRAAYDRAHGPFTGTRLATPGQDNRAASLRQTLNSLRLQTYDAFEAREMLRRALFDFTLEEGGENLAEADRKSALQEYLQGRGQSPAEYRLVGETGPDHQKQFQVEVWMNENCLASGAGTTKKEAEQQAARRALDRLLAQTVVRD